MGLIDEWRDPMNLNRTDRSVKVKVYLPESYSDFGCGFKEHKKYLPCMAILERLSGDSFYSFTMLTEDGPVRSCGYAFFFPAADIEKKLNRHVWNIQIFHPVESVEDKSQPILVIRCDDNLVPTGGIFFFDSIDKAAGALGRADHWALVSDLVFEK